MEQAARSNSGPSVVEPQVGDVIGGKYLVERVIGRGGMGRVLAAVHTTTGKRVALKWILNDESEEARERFAREAKAAGRIHHANVVDVYDVLEHDGAMCLVMELLRGESLASLLAREHTLPADAAVPLAVQIARGLHAAHEEGVIHRDLKPGNVFLTEGQGESGVKLLDFGISKILDATDGEPVTKSGAVLGTPHYMAPEQVLGMGGSDVRVDVYALGAVLYEMLAGRPPHTHEKVTALLVQIATVPTDPITDRVPGLSPLLGAVIMKALTKNPADRYPTVAAFAQALEPFTDVRFDGASGERRVKVIDRSDPDGLGTPSHVATLLATPSPTVPEHADATPPTRNARLDEPQPPPRSVGTPLALGGLALAALGLLAWWGPWRASEPTLDAADVAASSAELAPADSRGPIVAPAVVEAPVEPIVPPPVAASAVEASTEDATTEPSDVIAAREHEAARRRRPHPGTVAEAAPTPPEPPPVAATEVEARIEPARAEPASEPTPAIRRTEVPRAGRIGLDDF